MARLSRITAHVSPNSFPTTAVALDDSHPLAVQEVAHACGAEVAWVVALVEVGIVEASPRGSPADDWRFGSAELHRALEVRRLEREFGVELDAAALILDLQYEVRRLRAALHAQGR